MIGPTLRLRRVAMRAKCLPHLLVLLALGLLLTSPESLHVHRSSTPGLYNAECPLAELAAGHGDASLPSAPPAMRAGFPVGIAPMVAPVGVRALVAVAADSRAPPFA